MGRGVNTGALSPVGGIVRESKGDHRGGGDEEMS